MRLLNVETYEFGEFPDENERPPYVITSHRWQGAEITYQQFQARDQNPVLRQLKGFEKIENFCRFVQGWKHVPVRQIPDRTVDDPAPPPKYTPEPNKTVSVDCSACMVEREPCSHDLPACERCQIWKLDCKYPARDDEDNFLKWIWIDTCCINKESTTELTEAINSMFRWYTQAAVCLAYLYDVPSLSETPHVVLDRFQQSVWFRRGWTLQELIAPQLVVFVNKDWEVFGHKAPGTPLHSLGSREPPLFTMNDIRTPLNSWVARASGIPGDILASLKGCDSVEIAEKRGWMTGRKTARIEDAFYCLLGICGVTMPLVYGEREEAEYRLEEAIERKKKRVKSGLPLADASSTPSTSEPGPTPPPSQPLHRSQTFAGAGHGPSVGDPNASTAPARSRTGLVDSRGVSLDASAGSRDSQEFYQEHAIAPNGSSPNDDHESDTDSTHAVVSKYGELTFPHGQEGRHPNTEKHRSGAAPKYNPASPIQNPYAAHWSSTHMEGEPEKDNDVRGVRGRSRDRNDTHPTLTTGNVEQIPWRHRPSQRYPVAPAVSGSPPPDPRSIDPDDHVNERGGDSPTRAPAWSTRQPRAEGVTGF